jgi:hypothetical protein
MASQTVKALYAAPMHNHLRGYFILFYESKIITQIVTFCNGVDELSTVLGYDTLLLGDWFLMFPDNIVVISSRLEMSKNAANQLPGDAASQARRTDIS